MAAMKERAKDRATPFSLCQFISPAIVVFLFLATIIPCSQAGAEESPAAAAPGAKRQDLIASAKQFKNPLDFPKNHCEGVAYSCNYRTGIDYASMVLKDKADSWLTLTRSGVDAGNAYS